MTPDELPSLLSASPANSGEHGPACPDEHAISAYVDGALDSESRGLLQTHLADCGHCLALVGLLSRERSVDTAEQPSEAAIVRARALGRPGLRRERYTVPQWAAAAVVLIAVAALLRLSQPLGPADESGVRTDARTTRSAPANAINLQLLDPVPGATVSTRHLTVRWTPVPGAHYYDVRVVTDAGDVVTEEHVAGTEWRPTHLAALRPGTEYFVHVDAYISDDKAVSSEHVAFHVSD